MTIAYQAPQALDLALPWQEDAAQEEKFKRLLKRVLISLALLFIVIPFLKVYEKEYEERELDIVKTEIILEPVIIAPEPTPEPLRPQPKPKEKPKPIQKKASEKKDPVAIKKEQDKKVVVKEQGLETLADDLNALRQSLDMTKLKKKNVSTSQGGKIARADSTVLGEDSLTQKSEGINVDDSLLKNKQVALVAHESKKLDGFVLDDMPSGDQENFYSNVKGSRTTESIRRVLEGAKGRMYVQYQRALRDHPDLGGVFTFSLKIEPDGSVSELRKISSELNLPELEAKILDFIRKLNFGAEDVAVKPLTYRFNFLPN